MSLFTPIKRRKAFHMPCMNRKERNAQSQAWTPVQRPCVRDPQTGICLQERTLADIIYSRGHRSGNTFRRTKGQDGTSTCPERICNAAYACTFNLVTAGKAAKRNRRDKKADKEASKEGKD